MAFKSTCASFDKEDKFVDGFKRFSDSKLSSFISEGQKVIEDVDSLNLSGRENANGVYANMQNKAAVYTEISAKKHRDEVFKKTNDCKGKIQSIKRSNLSNENKKKQIKKEKEKLKKNTSKDKTKLAQKTAVSKMLRMKAEAAKEIEGNQSVSGNALYDGNQGLMKVLTSTINPVNYIKKKIAMFISSVAPTIMQLVVIMLVVTLVLGTLFQLAAAFTNAASSLEDYLNNILLVDTQERTNVAISEDEIAAIVGSINPCEEKKPAIEFALSKVGYPYSQALRCSGRAYDCSSLCYYAYLNAGVDFAPVNHYPPTAASLASQLNSADKTVPIDQNLALRPGDLIFYGGSNNNRYLGIYHVAIYIGKGKCVEAYDTEYGVVYGTVRTKNLVMICRP